MEFDCEFTRDEAAVVADWPGRTFEFRVPYAGSTLEKASVQFFLPGYGHLNGYLRFADGEVLYLGSNDKVTVSRTLNSTLTARSK